MIPQYIFTPMMWLDTSKLNREDKTVKKVKPRGYGISFPYIFNIFQSVYCGK